MTRSHPRNRLTFRPLAAIALAIAAFAAPLASAQAAVIQARPPAPHDDRQDHRPAPPTPPRPGQGPTRPGPGPAGHAPAPPADRYGAWNASWGARPAAPPRSFTRTADWHRHVHACQTRFRSYNPATDRYTVRRNVTAVCRL